MTDDDYLDAVRRARAESVQFFTSDNRIERELWVTRQFVTNLGMAFAEDELVWISNDPPDVCFRDARFEIKEILDPRRRRHAEYWEALKQAETATNPANLLEQFTPRDATILEIFELVQSRAEDLAKSKYPPAVTRGLDLLFYVNREDVFGLDQHPFPDTEPLISLGWRSLSFLMGHRSCVLAADRAAPSFLAAAAGRIVHRAGSGE